MTYVNPALRRLVIERAAGCCEYCRLPKEDNTFPFAIDHIISTKHGGETAENKLVLSCAARNSYKGSDIALIDWATGQAIFLFHPRTQLWNDHFSLNETLIIPAAAEARVTIRLLRLNSAERLALRRILHAPGTYPC